MRRDKSRIVRIRFGGRGSKKYTYRADVACKVGNQVCVRDRHGDVFKTRVVELGRGSWFGRLKHAKKLMNS